MKSRRRIYILLGLLLIAGLAWLYRREAPSSLGPRIPVVLDRCVDGDTAWFLIDGQSVKTRFLAIDAPELRDGQGKSEAGAKEAAERACELLVRADRLELETDPQAEAADRYGRKLAWVWADGTLVQDELVREGYAKVAYLYADYRYDEELLKAEEEARQAGIGIWQGEAK